MTGKTAADQTTVHRLTVLWLASINLDSGGRSTLQRARRPIQALTGPDNWGVDGSHTGRRVAWCRLELQAPQ